MSQLIKMPVESFRRIATSFEQEGKNTYVAVVNVGNLSKELDEWRKINPRHANIKSAVAKRISDSLQDAPKDFFFKNRGITVLVENATFDNTTGVLSLELSKPDEHGILDGGHTYKVIMDALDTLDTEDGLKALIDARVRLEILEGFRDRDDIVDIVEARNTSTQVKDQSLADLRGQFDAIKQVLSDKRYADNIAYKESEFTEGGDKKNIDIRDILSYLICFDVNSFDKVNHPITAYSSKASVLKHVTSHREDIDGIIPLLPQILELRDTIYKELPATHNKNGGKFGRLNGVTQKKQKVILPFTGAATEYVIPSSFIYPMLAAFRNLVNYENGKYTWKRNPLAFFDQIKDELVVRLIDQALNISNPNKLGKDKATWRSCYDCLAIEVAGLQI